MNTWPILADSFLSEQHSGFCPNTSFTDGFHLARSSGHSLVLILPTHCLHFIVDCFFFFNSLYTLVFHDHVINFCLVFSFCLAVYPILLPIFSAHPLHVANSQTSILELLPSLFYMLFIGFQLLFALIGLLNTCPQVPDHTWLQVPQSPKAQHLQNKLMVSPQHSPQLSAPPVF